MPPSPSVIVVALLAIDTIFLGSGMLGSGLESESWLHQGLLAPLAPLLPQGPSVAGWLSDAWLNLAVMAGQNRLPVCIWGLPLCIRGFYKIAHGASSYMLDTTWMFVQYAYCTCKMQYGSTKCVSIGPSKTTCLYPITNPTPLQMHPNWLGQRVYPNHQGSRMHPNYCGSQVLPNGWGSWIHPNGPGSQVWPGWGRRCALALPSQIALCACGSNWNTTQYACCTNIHIASNICIWLLYAYSDQNWYISTTT